MPSLQRIPYIKGKGELADLGEPLHIWAPKGGYDIRLFIDIGNMPVNTTYTDIVLQVRAREPDQRPLTSGEWGVARERLQEADPKLEKSMITGAYERTATILVYSHGTRSEKWHDGLLIQLPEVDEEGNFVRDPSTGILKARDISEMALPIDSGYIGNFSKELATFFDTIHGKEGAMQKLPDYAYFHAIPEGERNIVRGGWSSDSPEHRRVSVNGTLEPLNSNGNVASRVAAEEKI